MIIRTTTVLTPLLVIICSLVGCANGKTEYVSLGQKFALAPVPEAKCRIIVIWPSDKMVASAATPRVLIGGTEVGTLEPLGYLDAFASPGNVTVATRYAPVDGSRELTKMVEVDAVAGGEIYVQYEPKPGFFAGELTLKQLDTVAGRQLALATRRSKSF